MKIRCYEVGDIKPWHRWFAWRPVYLGPHDKRWLEFVWRRAEYRKNACGRYWQWYYSETPYDY